MATVTNQTEFKNAISGLAPEILVANDISLTSPTNIGYAVSIKGEQGASLFWGNPTASNPNMLVVTSTGKLTIESLTLDAQGRNGTLVQVNGGSFIMNAGVVMKNVTSTTAQSIVKVGNISTRVGGAFTMNGGLITGMKGSDTVFIADGTMTMNNDAAIDGNTAAGITAIWSKVTMAGRSRIANNESKQPGGGCAIVECEMIMGVNEGDAPIITGNRSPYDCGGLFLTNDSTLTMRYGAEVSDNFAKNFAGGIGAQDTVISMRENAAIRNNKTDGEACGLVLSKNTTAVLEDQAQISGHAANGRGGGIYMQLGALLEMKGDASVFANTATDGAGIFLNASTASIGLDDSSSSVFNNTASGKGGGAFISAESVLDLTGQARFYDNTATQGNGIYKIGLANLSMSPEILDGLYFDELLSGDSAGIRPTAADAQTTGHHGRLEPYAEVIIIDPIKLVKTAEDGVFSVPFITAPLTGGAQIQLEASSYISPKSVPFAVSEKGGGYAKLGETDRAAWRLPPNWGPGYAVVLNDALDQVLVTYETYSIVYKNLRGAANPNPTSYCIADLPIILSDPGQRSSYLFKGWYDAEGRRITEIPVGTTGDIVLTAAWEKVFLLFDGNAHCVTNMPEAINVEPGETIPIPSTIPSRSCYCFAGWNTSPSGTGASYAPGGVITVENGSIELFAQWRRLSNCCNNDRYRY